MNKLLSLLHRLRIIKRYSRDLPSPWNTLTDNRIVHAWYFAKLAYYALREWAALGWIPSRYTEPADNGNMIFEYAVFIDTPKWNVTWFWEKDNA